MSDEETILALIDDRNVRGYAASRIDRDTARGILADIRAGKIPGLALKTYDGTTCWQCEKCGKTRTGRGCMVCLEAELSALRPRNEEMRELLREAQERFVRDRGLSERIDAALTT